MPLPEMTEEGVRFCSGALALEGLLALPPGEPRAITVICHPHPLFGGDMRNSVVRALRDAALRAGSAALRFDFRGVGGSGGRPAGLPEGRDDLRAALECARRRCPGLPLWLAGYSFGAAVAGAVAAEEAAVARIVLVAPPLAMEPEMTLPRGRPGLVIAGDQDPFCPLERARSLVGQAGMRLEVLSCCDHFFAGREPEIGSVVADWLAV